MATGTEIPVHCTCGHVDKQHVFDPIKIAHTFCRLCRCPGFTVATPQRVQKPADDTITIEPTTFENLQALKQLVESYDRQTRELEWMLADEGNPKYTPEAIQGAKEARLYARLQISELMRWITFDELLSILKLSFRGLGE